MMDRDEVPETNQDLIHRLRVAAEHELDVTPESSPLHAWLAAEADELAVADDARAARHE